MFSGWVAGLVAGTLCGLSRLHYAGPIDVVVNSVPVWLLLPLVVGAATGSVRAAVLAAVAQLATFYAVTGTLDGVALWTAAAVGGGTVFGSLGAALTARWRAGRAAGA
jgi:hypothetical protein